MPYYHLDNYPHKVKIENIFCLARTYSDHAKEMGAEVTPEPLLFLKPTNAVIFNNQSVVIPKRSKLLHHEVELGVIMAEKGKNIPKNTALDKVLGYLLAFDITARDIQQEAKSHGWPWTISKGFDTFCPISKVVLKQEVPEPNKLDLTLKVNGEVRQRSNTKKMIFQVEEIIEFVSEIMTLQRGDMILTGTPKGVGRLRKGDIIEGQLSDICSLKVNVM